MDRATKVILAAIAIALWVNVIEPWVPALTPYIQPRADISRITRYLNRIMVDTDRIERRVCAKTTLCSKY